MFILWVNSLEWNAQSSISNMPMYHHIIDTEQAPCNSQSARFWVAWHFVCGHLDQRHFVNSHFIFNGYVVCLNVCVAVFG
jgi:hypothetical protein